MTPESSTTRRPPFGLLSACGLVIANMIGAGVFTTSGFSLFDLSREYVLLAWVVAGLIALCGAYSYGLLSQQITESGGEYLFLSRAVHPAVGFVAGWVSLLQGFTGAIAFAAVTLEAHLLPEGIRPAWCPPGGLAVASILLFATLHVWVMRTGVWTQNAVVGLKLILLGAFLGFAFFQLPLGGWPGWQVTEEPLFSWLGLATALVYISLSYSGFNAAVYIAEEIRNPHVNVPRAMLISTLLVLVIYVALNAVFIYGPEPAAIKGQKDIAVLAAQSLGGVAAATLVRGAIALALLSSVSSMIIAGPRVYAKMADDGVFPPFFRFGRVGTEQVPARAIWFQAGLACVVVLLTSLRELLELLSFTLSVTAALTVSCVFRHPPAQEGERKGVLRVALPLIYMVVTLSLAGLLVYRDYQSASTWWFSKPLLAFLFTIGSGLGIYGIWRVSRNR